MNITDIRIRRTYTDTRLRALVSVTVDGDFAVHDIKVIDGPTRLFIAMPSRRSDDGGFRDVCHPITAQARNDLEQKVLEAYTKHLEENKDEPKQQPKEEV